MKKSFVFVFVMLATAAVVPVFAGKTMLRESAVASYYGEEYDGRPTSSGEIFDMYAMTAAHKTLPFGTMLEVTSLENGNSVVVRVNDRGPFVENREIDVSQGAAEKLGMITAGIARVSIAIVDGDDAVTVEAPPAADSGTAAHPVPVSTADNTAKTVQAEIPAGYNGALWRIQLGSFAGEENALRMVRELRAAGLEPAYERSGGKIRVVLASVTDYSLEDVKKALNDAGFRDCLLRREN